MSDTSFQSPEQPLFEKDKVIRYLIWTFALAYLIQFGAAFLYQIGQGILAQGIIALMMFIPTLGVLLAKGNFRHMGWKPQIRKNIPAYLMAWLLPILFTALGAYIYFLVFPSHFDISGDYLVQAAGQEALDQLAAQGLTYPVYLLISVGSALLYAPFLNMFFALGEEIGWRGFLYPQLKARFGPRKGWILGGLIWGAWHWPLIWLIGYEYGTDYFGFPILGMLLFACIAAGWGILHDWLYELSGSIWVPSLFHGAINAAAGLPLAVCIFNIGSARLLGPAPNTLLAGLPFLIMAGIRLMKKKG